MSEAIQIPQAAAQQLNDIVLRKAVVERELQNAVALVLATLGAPDGSQIRIEADGSMVAIAPAPVPDTE